MMRGNWNGVVLGEIYDLFNSYNAGPYSNNGFQPEPFTSHRDFVEGDLSQFTLVHLQRTSCRLSSLMEQ